MTLRLESTREKEPGFDPELSNGGLNSGSGDRSGMLAYAQAKEKATEMTAAAKKKARETTLCY